jgi:lipoyl(octanoyl) transferase
LINVVHLGTVPYAVGLKLQAELVAARKQGQISDTLLLLEHTPVITLGRSAKQHNIRASKEQLAARGVELFECDRGGDVTFHGPGQLVGYPIFDLFGYTPRIGAVEFMRRIEEVLIRSCANFGIACQRVPGLTGVWTMPQELRNCGTAELPNCADQSRSSTIRQFGNPAHDQRPTTNDSAKIAAIGVHISRGVTSHGFALNVNTDLDYFNLIVPCGIVDKPVTSIARELGEAQPIEKVAESTARHFGAVFSSQILWVETVDQLLGRAVGMPLQRPAELGGQADRVELA